MKKFFGLFVAIGVGISGCSQPGGSGVSSKFTQGTPISEVTHQKLTEVSGMTASSVNAGHIWVLNDSGNEPEVYLINEKSEIVLTCRLDGIRNRDWEDIAVGPGPEEGQTYLYIGDIGDNKAKYPVKYIYRFPEPKRAPGPGVMNVTNVETISFRLADAVKDTESLLVDPASGNIYVISKREQPVTVYVLKNVKSTDTLVAEKVMTLPYEKIVAGDVDKNSGDVLLKTYDKVYYWQNKDKVDLPVLLKQPPEELAYRKEPQGESITWAKDGTGFYTLSEKKKNQDVWLYFYKARGRDEK
jgi:hypothetical protein